MKFWLVKSEPSAWSWEDHVKAGTAEWDGVRSHQANNNMKKMKIGDRAFFYHSVSEKKIVGVLEVVKEHYPDNTDTTEKFGMVDFKVLFPVNKPVTLAQIKAKGELSDLSLVKQSRLSVLEVSPKHWQILCKMSATNA
ncbi:MAG: EVE domain-containing protein [Pseudomonadota bacterium]|nr:EVE domain-containing protein [Pseudomonadota bacterium]